MTTPRPAAEHSDYRDADGEGVCPLCGGTGTVTYWRDGYEYGRECECMARKRSRARAQRSGLGELYDRYTLVRYTDARPWQAALRRKALDYLKDGAGWFFVCGRSGSGKTHLTAAVARELIEAGCETRYFMWRQDAPRLKALVNDPRYEERMRALVDSDVLVIDDLWKGGSVSDADVNLAFELLNSRYNLPKRRTLISSELTLEEIMRIDEAVGSRIYERAGGYVLKTGDENLRLTGIT